MGNLCRPLEAAPRGSDHFSAKLKEEDIPLIHGLHLQGVSYIEIGKRFGVTANPIGKIIRGKAWTHVK